MSSTTSNAGAQDEQLARAEAIIRAVYLVPPYVIGSIGKLIVVVLATYIAETGRASASIQMLSVGTDRGRTTVMREVDKLIDLGVIAISAKGRGSSSTVYDVHMDALLALQKEQSPPKRTQSARGMSAVVRRSVPIGARRNDAQIPRSVQLDVLQRDRRECRYCGSPERLTIDHVVPRSFGGSNEPANLVAACVQCNSRKNARTPEQAGMTLLEVPS